MQAEQGLRFGPYRFDPGSGQLWRGTLEVRLTPKALAVLGLLVTRPGQVVTKDELFQAVWSDTVVSDDALTSCIQELRHALNDDARKPRYIETVHRRGYRFLPAVTPLLGSGARGQRSVFSSSPAPGSRPPNPLLVGRESELSHLHGWLAKALHGERQIVFVTGEPGIGKTTLIEAFLRGSRNWELGSGSSPPQVPNPRAQSPEPGVWVAVGRCIEHYGAGEAYLPMLEALGRLCRQTDEEPLIAMLKQYAPTWLVQMPALLKAEELETLQHKTAGATRERMLRELAEALEVITAERPLMLVLEDLHWSDVSTLDLLSMLARRQEPARLLVIGTYRPVEVLTREHPLKGIKQELQLHGQCEELALDFLREDHVAEYLARRTEIEIETERKQDRPLADMRGSQDVIGVPQLARMIHRRTDGNPLFMVNVVEHLLSQGVLVQTDGQWVLKNVDLAAIVPENLRQLIEQQLARVRPDERKVLEAASVAGAEFAAAAVAAGVETTVDVVEEQCEELARRAQFLRTTRTVEWPDGTVTARYSFLHALYQDVIYARLTARRQQRLHQQIGEREEQAYGDRVREIAAELAMHFERGRDYKRAVQYLQHAGENAVRRSAYQEAISLLTKGLELLNPLPDTPERAQQELTLQVALGAPFIATKGYGAPEVGKTYARARELCQQVGETPQLFPVLRGLRLFYSIQAEHQTARELGEQLLRLAQSARDAALLGEAHMALQSPLLWLGEVTAALQHAEQGIALYARQQHRSQALVYGQDPGVTCLTYAAFALWYLGYPTQALHRSHEALTLAQELAHPFSLAYAVLSVALLHHLRREGPAVQERAEALIALSSEQGFAAFVTWGTMLRGWALVKQGKVEEGITQMRQGLTALRATGVEVIQPRWLLLLAEAYEKGGRVEEGLSVLAEALATAHKNGTLVHEAELYLKGELLLQQFKVQGSTFKVEIPQSAFRNPHSEAEACFLKAIDIARKQQAKSLELRATTSLARLWQSQGKKKQAHKMLSKVYHWFTEGFDTKDLQEAKALLEELRHRVIEPLKN